MRDIAEFAGAVAVMALMGWLAAWAVVYCLDKEAAQVRAGASRMPAPPCCLYPSPNNAMQPEDAVNMDIPMTEEEWAIWQALWRVPEFRRHYGLDHAGSLTQREIGLYLGLTRQRVFSIERAAMRKIKIAFRKFKDEI